MTPSQEEQVSQDKNQPFVPTQCSSLPLKIILDSTRVLERRFEIVGTYPERYLEIINMQHNYRGDLCKNGIWKWPVVVGLRAIRKQSSIAQNRANFYVMDGFTFNEHGWCWKKLSLECESMNEEQDSENYACFPSSWASWLCVRITCKWCHYTKMRRVSLMKCLDYIPKLDCNGSSHDFSTNSSRHRSTVLRLPQKLEINRNECESRQK